jgi:low affinity Fe/Cu permease
MRPTRPRSNFTRFAKWTAHVTGRPAAFAVAVAVILIWAVAGPFFNYSNTWQLAINSSTTIVTLLMVFLIQSTQNRDAEAVQVKLDEIIRAMGHAKNELMDLEELEEEDLDALKKVYQDLAEEARNKAGKDRRRRPPAANATPRNSAGNDAGSA